MRTTNSWAYINADEIKGAIIEKLKDWLLIEQKVAWSPEQNDISVLIMQDKVTKYRY